MATRRGRVLRGLVASGVAVFVAAFAHAAGGGTLPGPGIAALAFAFTALASIGLAGRRTSRVRIALSVILSQAVFHLLFAVTTAPSAVTVQSGRGMPGMDSTIVTTGAAATPLMLGDGWMWLAHAVAAAVTIAAIVWGETALRSLGTTIILALRRVIRTPAVAHDTRQPLLPVVPAATDRRRAATRLTGLKHRGPPIGFASI